MASLGFTKSFTDGKMRQHGKRVDSKRSTKPVISDASKPQVSQRNEKPGTENQMDDQPTISHPSNEEMQKVDPIDICSENEDYDYECDTRRKPTKLKLRFKFGRFPRLVPVE